MPDPENISSFLAVTATLGSSRPGTNVLRRGRFPRGRLQPSGQRLLNAVGSGIVLTLGSAAVAAAAIPRSPADRTDAPLLRAS